MQNQERMMTTDIKKLSAVPYTLMIPLVARARGREFFPHDYLVDPTAERVLKDLGTPGDEFMHKGTVRAVQDRTRIFVDLAKNFFNRNPEATGANVGCGLSDYFQWLDNGRNSFVDADLPEVMHIRRQRIQPHNERNRFTEVSLTSSSWWDDLALPPEPVLLIIEGVLMYLTPQESQGVLQTFAQRAAPGSELLFDHMCWLGVGQAQRHSPVMKHTKAEFSWGIRNIAELTAADKRLRLLSQHHPLSGQNFLQRAVGKVFQTVTTVPFYGIARIGVD